MMMRMVKTISTLYGANHRRGRRDGRTDGRRDRRRGQFPSFPLVAFGPHLEPDAGIAPRKGESDHVGAFPNFLVKGLIALPFPVPDGRTDSSFSVDSSVILNQVYTFAATA